MPWWGIYTTTSTTHELEDHPLYTVLKWVAFCFFSLVRTLHAVVRGLHHYQYYPQAGGPPLVRCPQMGGFLFLQPGEDASCRGEGSTPLPALPTSWRTTPCTLSSNGWLSVSVSLAWRGRFMPWWGVYTTTSTTHKLEDHPLYAVLKVEAFSFFSLVRTLHAVVRDLHHFQSVFLIVLSFLFQVLWKKENRCHKE
jgi:hypothetical protein